MRKFLITLTLVSIIAGSAAAYFYWWKPAQVNSWTFVPDNAIAVFQPVSLANLLSHQEEKKILSNLKSLPEFQTLSKQITKIDSIGKKMNSGQSFIDNSNILISFHPGNSSASTLANLYIIEINNIQSHDYLARLEKHLKSKGFNSDQRLYNGYQINEIKNKQTEITYILYKNYLVLSFYPFLVDDAIRMLEKGIKGPLSTHQDIQLSTSQKLTGEGRVYLNSQLLAKYINRLIDTERYDLSWLKTFSHLMHLDGNITDDRIDLAGFAILDQSQENYLSVYNNSRGIGFEMKNVIPDHSNTVLHVSFNDILQWHNGLKKYWKRHRTSYLSQMGEIENRYHFDTQKFLQTCTDELGLFILDSKKSFSHEKILAIEHKDQFAIEALFKSLSKASNGDSSAISSEYAGRHIGFAHVEELPFRLFGEFFKGFGETYFMVTNKHLFIGSSQNALEILIDDIDDENTWQKSIRFNKFLESTNDDANLSLYTKGTGFWSLAQELLGKPHADYIKNNEIVFNQLEYGAIQFTNVDNNYYTNISIEHPGKLIEKQEAKTLDYQSQLTFDAPLISKPFAVRSHKDRSLEMMVQDSLYNLYLVTKKMEIDLTIPLDGPLSTPVYQVDYYKNKKLQYLFALENSIHIVDRTGTYIPGYPIQVPTGPAVKFLSLIDYKKSRDYRIQIATEKNYYYTHDKTGRQLKGWNPKKLTGSPVMKGEHLRVRNADFMIFLQDNGIVYALSRQGLGKKGFPIDLKGSISSPLNITKGATLSDTELVAVTNSGELVEFNLLGEIIRKDQFYKSGVNDIFQLVNASDGSGYIVKKQSNQNLTLFNANLEELFQLELNTLQSDIQYYKFKSGYELIAVIDQTNQLTYLYNLDGRRLTTEPIPTGKKLGVLFHESKNRYEIFCSIEDRLTILHLDQ